MVFVDWNIRMRQVLSSRKDTDPDPPSLFSQQTTQRSRSPKEKDYSFLRVENSYFKQWSTKHKETAWTVECLNESVYSFYRWLKVVAVSVKFFNLLTVLTGRDCFSLFFLAYQLDWSLIIVIGQLTRQTRPLLFFTSLTLSFFLQQFWLSTRSKDK